MIILNPKFSLDGFFAAFNGNKSLLILDYDGTLAPFVTDPRQAYPYPGVFDRIKELMEEPTTKAVIISGRSIDSLTRLLPPPIPELWGCHGGERLHVNSNSIVSIPLKLEIKQILAVATLKAGRVAPELFIEAKPYSVALHWREKNPILAKPAIECWRNLINDHPLEIKLFDEGVELRVIGIDKGYVIKRLLEDYPEYQSIAYLGDDFTDEQAFNALQQKNALKILVRKEPRQTLADVCITPPEEVIEFLDHWLEAVQGGVYGSKNQ